MNSSAAWQHDVLVQTLYSGRYTSDKAIYFGYSLAQARADVFFSLLFGGRVVCSAGTFFDSPVALRIFGELFADPRFPELQAKWPWLPLHLCTDNPVIWDRPLDYVLDRWRKPDMKFNIFRELEEAFTSAAPFDVSKRRMTAADYLADGQFTRIANLYEPFLKDFDIPNFSSFHAQLPETDVAIDDRAINAKVPSLMTEQFATWLRCILNYLDTSGCFTSMPQQTYESTLLPFSLLSVIEHRAAALRNVPSITYNPEEFDGLTADFKGVVGTTSMMNAFHRHGREIYGSYFQLINHWLEVDWHTTRHAAYGSSTCLLSSNWEERAVFDFDPLSKVHYLQDPVVDDSLRRTQEKFGELDWGILFKMVSDHEWHKLVVKIKYAESESDVADASDKILNLLAKRISEFTFSCDDGRVAIVAKNVTTGANYAAAAGLVTSLFDSTLGGLLGVAKYVTVAGRAAAVGAQFSHRKFNERRLRTAVVPRLYLGSDYNKTPTSEQDG